MDGTAQCEVLRSPPASDWICTFCDAITWRPQKGKEPNAFHRFMQGVCFGFKWRKEPMA